MVVSMALKRIYLTSCSKSSVGVFLTDVTFFEGHNYVMLCHCMHMQCTPSQFGDPANTYCKPRNREPIIGRISIAKEASFISILQRHVRC